MFFFIVSVPPHQILVYDASGRDVSGAVGPLYEGDSLVLSCEVRGGKSNEFCFFFFNQFLYNIWPVMNVSNEIQVNQSIDQTKWNSYWINWASLLLIIFRPNLSWNYFQCGKIENNFSSIWRLILIRVPHAHWEDSNENNNSKYRDVQWLILR